MRQVLNISLPPKTVAKIKKEVAASDYATVSEFFRDLLREREQRETLQKLKKQQAEVSRYIKVYQQYPETDTDAQALIKLATSVLKPQEW